MESEGTLKNIPSDGTKNGPHTTRPSHGRTSGPTRRSTKGQWTAEEDDVLKMAVQRFKGKNWKKIAECFKDRTDVQCLHRWQKVLNPDLVKGPWSKEEDEVIIELVSKYGAKKWSTIAQHLPGRIGKQCRERWHNHLNPNINKEAWTQDEELTLIRAHQIYGNKWAELTKFLPGRSDNAIKNHWNSSVKKKLDMYLASGLLSQFECVPLISHPNQSAASSSSKAQQSSEADSIVRGAEFEEASECSQGSTIACLSQSTNNANPHPREQCRITEESSSVPSSEDYYPAFEEATFIISQEQCKMEDEYLEHDNSFNFAQKVWQTDPHLLPDMSLLDLGQESSDLFLPLLTDQDNLEAVPFPLESSAAFNSSTSFVDMVVGTDTENLAANSECRMVYPEVNHSGCFFAEDGIQEVDRHADTLLHNSSTFRYPDNFTSSSCSMPPDMLANSFTQPLAFTTQLPTDASFMYSPNPNQISYFSQENTEEHMLPTAHDCFVYPKEAYSSPCEDKCNETKEPPKLVPANDFFIEPLADSQCSSFKDRDTKTDEQDPGALCYEPPRFPSLDIPFFSCDLIQCGSDMQQEYSPLGIRQLMISSSMTPFKLWDSPTREDTTEAVLKSAAKTFTGTPSILKKRHRDLVSPLSERRYEKKLEGPSKQQSFSGLANDLSRLEKIFDECMDRKGPLLSLSPRKGNLEVLYEEKENVQPPCVHTGNEGNKSLVMSENNMSPKESKSGECLDKKIGDRNASVDLRNEMEMQAKDLAGILVEHDMSPSPRGLSHLSCRKNHVILSSSENSYFSIVCSPRVDKTRDGATSLIGASLQSSSRSGKKVVSGCKGAASESNSTFMDTPFKRSIESPSAWKSPWFLNTFVPGPRVDTEITIEDIGYSVSPGDRSYDAIALMKQLGDQTASTFADAQEILGDETPDTIMKEKCYAKINVEGADTSCNPSSQTTDNNNLISPSNFKKERRTLDFSECVTPETKAGMFSNGKSSTSQSSHLLKSCR